MLSNARRLDMGVIMRAMRDASDTRPMPNANARSGSASKGELAVKIVILGQYLVLANPILNTIRY